MKRLGPLILFLPHRAGWMVRRARQTGFQPAGVAVRAGVDRALMLIAVAGWRTFERDRGGGPMKLWWAQMALNILWTPVLFGAHQIGLALVVILLLLAAILAFIAAAWRQDRVAAWLFTPYAVWVAFASLLNGSIFALN
jgi:benzodiazapine receptor